MNIEELRKKVVTDKGRLNNNFIDLIKDVLIEEFPEMKIAERAFLFFNNLSTRPTCDCGGRLKFVSFVKGYHDKCRVCKAEETCLSRYGVRKPSMLEEFKQKAIITNREKYGVDHHTQHEDVKDKIKITNLERYGFEVPGKNAKVKEKAKKTCLVRYGEVSSILDANVKAKADLTNLERYGDISPIRTEEVKQRAIKTNLERYGVKNPSFDEKIKNKIAANIMSSKFRRSKKTLESTHEFLFREEDYLSRTHLRQHFDFRCKKCGTDYHSTMINGQIPSCPVCYPRLKGTSKGEMELLEFLKKTLSGFKLINKDRSCLGNFELDIIIPEKKLAFEFNGMYWHSSKFKSKDYHLLKSEACKVNGIRLVHVFEDVWVNKRNIIEDRIESILQIYDTKIYARKCSLKKIPYQESFPFFQANHLQGNAISSHQYGLFYESELVSVMTFGKPRFDKKHEWELIRFANKGGVKVVGGASRLLSSFIKEVTPKSIITYSDRCYGDSGFYETIGFKFVKNTPPGYFYVKNGTMERVHRLSLTKKKQEVLENYSPDLNEEENAFLNGYFRVYDSGQNIYELLLEP